MGGRRRPRARASKGFTMLVMLSRIAFIDASIKGLARITVSINAVLDVSRPIYNICMRCDAIFVTR